MEHNNAFKRKLLGATGLDGLTPLLAAALAACGGGGGGGSPPADTPRLSGDGDDPPPHNRHLFDGPIAGATVFVDMDNDGVADRDEPQFGPTGADGGFYLPDQYDNRQLIAVLDNARDADRPNEALEGQWLAEAGSEVISPLTHILVTTDLSQADLRALAGITAEVDLTKYNPFDDATRNATDEAVIEAGEKVAAVPLVA